MAAKTDSGGDHHLWLGATGADGTPQIRIDGRLTTVRCVVWEQARGPLPAGATVASCPDEARCIRLGHLSLGRKQRHPVGSRPAAGQERSRRGLGSMRQVRPGVWELAVSTAGVRHYRTVKGSEDDAGFALTAFAAEFTGRIGTLEALIAAYLAHLQNESRGSGTLRRYRQLWRQWLSPTVATVPLAALTAADLERPLAAMVEAGQSASSIHQAAVLLSGCLAWGQRHHHIAANPALGLRLPDGHRLAPPRSR